MQYLNKSFTLPTTTKRISQTDYEIAVGLRHPDGTLVQPKQPCGAVLAVLGEGYMDCSLAKGHRGKCEYKFRVYP